MKPCDTASYGDHVMPYGAHMASHIACTPAYSTIRGCMTDAGKTPRTAGRSRFFTFSRFRQLPCTPPRFCDFVGMPRKQCILKLCGESCQFCKTRHVFRISCANVKSSGSSAESSRNCGFLSFSCFLVMVWNSEDPTVSVETLRYGVVR